MCERNLLRAANLNLRTTMKAVLRRAAAAASRRQQLTREDHPATS